MGLRAFFAIVVMGMVGPGGVYAYEITLADPEADDYGPGFYTYPLDAVFTPGSFDITQVTVKTVAAKVRFEIEIDGQIEDPWGSGGGFSLQNIDIYIDQDGLHGSGRTDALERRNIQFSPSSAWEYVVWCAPPFDDFDTHVIDAAGNAYYSGIAVSVDEADDVITVDVPLSTIGSPNAGWRYVVLMLGQHGYEPGRVRPVMEHVGQWVLGGGDDGLSDSNVIDMVAEPGVNQEALLANYNPHSGVQPVLINRADSEAPAITHSPPMSWEAHVPLPVQSDIDDDVVVSASVFYRSPGEAFQGLPMARTGPVEWEAVIPGSAIEVAGLEYFVFATDATNSSMLPDSSGPFSVTITPDVTAPSIERLEAKPSVFSPNGDGYKDSTFIAVRLSEPGSVWLEVRESLGAAVRTLADGLPAESTLVVAWDGKNGSGENVADGTYEIRADCCDLAGWPGLPESALVVVDMDQPLRRLDVILLFHANQNLVPYGMAANHACYKGVLTTLRAHPTLKFMIHFSGSLISDLLWSDPETIEILRQGIRDGQFEIVGSTYIQNIIYSTRTSEDDFQFNQHQIVMHRDLIERVLGASPVSFWNPERVWTQNIVKLLTDNGYENVQVEDHILYDSGITGSEYAVRTTTYEGESVYVFDDDKTFEGMVNGAIDSGDTSSVMSFLRYLYEEDSDDRYAVCYHEDMEATGLWDYEAGEDPAVDFGNLDRLLTAFEQEPRVKITTYSDFLREHEPLEDISPIVDGAAQWMGASAWFSENSASEAEAYRQFFDAIRDTINAIHDGFSAYSPDTVSARSLIDHAWFTLCAHQYEFAVHGYQSMIGTTQWDLARTALVGARAAREALLHEDRVTVEDINADGISEIVFVTGGDLFVLSAYGGRLVYWFDLEHGTELVGNENFMRSYSETYTNDNAYVPVAVGCEAYPWLCGNMILPEVHAWTYEARRRCLGDSLWIGGQTAGSIVNKVLSYDVDSSRVDFNYDVGEVTITKRISPSLHSFDVEYTFASTSSEPRAVAVEIENGFSPGCLQVMMKGREILKYWDGSDTSSVFSSSMRGVVNTDIGQGLLFDFADSPTSIGGEEDIFGLEVNPRWDFEIPPYGSEVITLSIEIASFSGVWPPEKPDPKGRLLVFPNPSKGIVRLHLGAGAPAGAYANVYDLSGRLVRTLGMEGTLGSMSVSWDGRNLAGRPVADGIYFIRVSDGTSSVTGKVAIVR